MSRRIARAPPVSLAMALQVAGYPRAPLVGRRVLPTTAWVHLSVTEDTRRGAYRVMRLRCNPTGERSVVEERTVKEN